MQYVILKKFVSKDSIGAIFDCVNKRKIIISLFHVTVIDIKEITEMVLKIELGSYILTVTYT